MSENTQKFNQIKPYARLTCPRCGGRGRVRVGQLSSLVRVFGGDVLPRNGIALAGAVTVRCLVCEGEGEVRA